MIAAEYTYLSDGRPAGCFLSAIFLCISPAYSFGTNYRKQMERLEDDAYSISNALVTVQALCMKPDLPSLNDSLMSLVGIRRMPVSTPMCM